MADVRYTDEQARRAREYRANRPGRAADPTQTKTLRRRWSGEAFRRFRALKGIIRENVIERDVLGIKQRTGTTLSRRDALDDLAVNPLGPPGDPERFPDFETCVEAIMDPPEVTREDAERVCGDWEQNLAAQQEPFFPPGARLPRDAFDFPRDDQKVEEFFEWLDEMVGAGILERADNPAFGAVGGVTSAWQNTYIRQAYSKGLVHANFATKQIGLTVTDESLDLLFRNPRHAEQLGLLFTRAFGDLKGITDAMATEMRRTMAEGLANGWGAQKMARELNDRIDNIGINRARTLARTETVRATNEAALTRYQGLGVERVGAQVEFVTAGDLRVCPICQSLEGSTMPIDEARGLIPVHPNCRCMWLPVPPSGETRIPREGVSPVDVVGPPTLPSLRGPDGPRTPISRRPATPVTDADIEDLYVKSAGDAVDDFNRQVQQGDWDALFSDTVERDGSGFTLNAGDLSHYGADEGYVVGLTSRNLSKADASPEDLQRAIIALRKRHDDVIQRHPTATKIGVFNDPDADSDLLSVDFNVVLTDLDEAKELGAQLNQVGIWDAYEGRFVATGGTGDVVAETNEELLDILDDLDTLLGVTSDDVVVATTPAGQTVIYQRQGDDFLDETAESWARAVEQGEVPDEANVLRATRIETMDQSGVQGGINEQSMRALYDSIDAEDPTYFLKYYDDTSYGSGHDALAANTVLRRMDANAPRTALIRGIDPEDIGLDEPAGGFDWAEQLALEGIPGVDTLENRYDIVDVDDLAEHLAKGGLIGNTDMHRHNLLVDNNGGVWLVDNDIAMSYTDNIAKNGELTYNIAKRPLDHANGMGMVDQDEVFDFLEDILNEMEEQARIVDANWDDIVDGIGIDERAALRRNVDAVLRNGVAYPERVLEKLPDEWHDEAFARLGPGRLED